jgi:hypothetical protein
LVRGDPVSESSKVNVLDHLGAVPPREQVAQTPPTPPRPDRLTRKEALHSRAKVGATGFDQEMKVVAHYDVADERPLVSDDRLLQSVEQSASIRIIADNPLAGIAPRHPVIDGTLELNPKPPWHAPSLGAQRADCPAENKKQSLTSRSITTLSYWSGFLAIH